MTKGTKALTTAQYTALQTGLPTYCANTVFTIGGQTYTTAQVVALIVSILNTKLAVAPAKAAWEAAVLAIDQTETQNGKTVKGVRDVVALKFENAPETLATLAIVPRKTPAPLSTAARAAANAKRAATRKARGITSKKQKALLTGNVTGVTITPTTTPEAAPLASTGTGAGGGASASSAGAASLPAVANGSTPHP